MRRIYSLFIIAIFAMIASSSQSNAQEAVECANRFKSCITSGTAPQPFQELLNNNSRWYHDRPAISTGYYFVTDESTSAADIRPSATDFVDTTTNTAKWVKIVSGPRQYAEDFWESEDNVEGGYWFFRDPASNNGDIYSHDQFAIIDSADNAFAGPMKIGLPGGFRFNGIRYDSFYVSTNGLVALSNRRYLYDNDGNRRVEEGTAYDEESHDWYIADSYGRSRNGAGTEVEDATPDDFGYRYIANGGNPSIARRGIRAPGTAAGLTALPYQAPVIAPLYGDNHLSSYDNANQFVDPHGKVWYYRSDDKQKLYIYFMNLAPHGQKASPCGNRNFPKDMRIGDDLYVSANVQVILNNEDESVTMVYRQFNGVANMGFCQAPSEKIFLMNSVAGVRGFARHANFNRANQVTNVEYQQYTTHWSFHPDPRAPWPSNQLTVKYNQWQNTLRVVDIQYRVRDYRLDPFLNDLSFTEEVKSSQVANYELLAGEERIGAIQPVALIQNLSNDIQGVEGENFVQQDLEFQARFRIVNKAARRIVYQKTVAVDSACMALELANKVNCAGDPDVLIRLSEVVFDNGDYDATHYNNPVDDPTGTLHFPGDGSNTPSGLPLNGVPAYGMVQVFFPPFEPSEFQNNHIGRLQAFIIAIPQGPEDEDLGDDWPYDDTTSVPLFVMRRLESFYDDATEFHLVDGQLMPSVLKWVNIDAQTVDGEQISDHPLPPRGNWHASYDEKWSEDFKQELRQRTLNSPVIRMNRKTLANFEPATSPGGDEIRSFPIDMREKLNSVISFGVQRTASRNSWDRGYGDNRQYGPEPRVAYNNNPLSQYTAARAVSQRPDEIVCEIANNYVDDELEVLKHVTNIDDKQWRLHFRRYGQDPIEDMPAFGLYGAGGYRVGFLEDDKDSALQMNTLIEEHGMRANVYDDGIDFEFTKFYVAIPDTFINFDYDLAKNFRFRIKVMAHNDQKPYIPAIPDDDDNFFVDNVRILFEDPEATDIEVTSVKAVWPYSQAPATQVTNVPIVVNVVNNTSTDAPVYEIKVNLYKRGYGPDADGDGFGDSAIYCRKEIVGVHNARVNLRKEMPRFNAREAGPGRYKAVAIIGLPMGSDKDERNDTTYTEFDIEFGDSFAYDDINNTANDVPSEALIPGRGLNFFGAAYGGDYAYNYSNEVHAAGVRGGSGSGQVAMRFSLTQADTIKGYQAFFGTLNQAPDWIQFAIYTGSEFNPEQIIAETRVDKRRGEDDLRTPDSKVRYFGEYVDYRLDDPIVLQPNQNYWVVIAQLGETGLELGATGYRGGQRTTQVFLDPLRQQEPGIAGIHLNVHKEFRKYATDNVRLLNVNYFAMENSKGSGGWASFQPSEGNGAFAHLHHVGRTPADGGNTYTLTRGFWIPLLRPYFGEKSYNDAPDFEECDIIPVELTYFKGAVRNNGNELFWETASEDNNRGFYIEKKRHDEESEDAWKQITFVKAQGNGTSSHALNYNYTDMEVVPFVTYDYRLRQVDLDGTHNCNTEQVVTLTYEADLDITIMPNTPNPFSDNTRIKFFSPGDKPVTVEVLDMFGNVVKTFANDEAIAGEKTYDWDGTDVTGSKVSSGNYILRITAGDEVKTQKITYYK